MRPDNMPRPFAPEHSEPASEISPCRFCDSSRVRVQNIRDGLQVICNSCLASGPPTFYGREPKEVTRISAIRNWNRSDEIERLRGEVEKLRKLIEAAPAVAITECNQILGASDFDYGDMSAAVQKFRPGQRVRLVVESEA